MHRILIFIGGYLPGKKYGGPVISITNLVSAIGSDFEVFIVTTDHEYKTTEPYEGIKPGWNMVGKAQVFYLPDKSINFSTLSRIYDEIKPDLLYQNSFYDYMFALPALFLSKKHKKIPLLIAPRGELQRYSLTVKAFKKKVYINVIKFLFGEKNIYYHATSNDEKNDIVKIMRVAKDHVIHLSNCATWSDDRYEIPEKDEGTVKLVYFARIHSEKNLYGALNSLKDIQGSVEYDIYGPIEQADYWDRCKKVIEELPDNIIVKYCGILERDDLYLTISKYHALYMPTTMENFGHTIAEAVISNKPVIVSATTPWHDAPEHGAGWVYEYSDTEHFIMAIQQLVNMSANEYAFMVDRVIKYKHYKLKYEELKQSYINQFKNIISDVKSEGK